MNTITKIDTEGYLQSCREWRAEYKLLDGIYDGSYYEFIKDEFDSKRFMFVNEYYAGIVVETADYEELIGMLRVASRARQQFGATDAQILYLAKLAIDAETPLKKMECHTLTKGEASILIEEFLANAE